MIVLALLEVVYGLFSLLLAPVNIPSLPDNVYLMVYDLCEDIASGIAVLSQYTDLEYLLVLFGVVVLVDAGVLAYKFVMFFLRKIPMLGIE